MFVVPRVTFGRWVPRTRPAATWAKCTSEFEELLYKNSFNTAEVFKVRDKLTAFQNSGDDGDANTADRWRTNAETLLGYLDARGLKRVLLFAPEVLNLAPSRLRASVESLGNSRGFDLRSVAADCPSVFALEPGDAVGRLAALQEVFPKKSLLKLVARNVSLLTRPMEEVEERYRYLTVFMGQDQRDLIRSSALNYDINHLRARHLAAEWAGVWKPVKLKMKMSQVQRGKPNLLDLFSTTDEDFCRKVVGIGLDEYAAFQEMLESGQISLRDVVDNEEDSDEEV